MCLFFFLLQASGDISLYMEAEIYTTNAPLLSSPPLRYIYIHLILSFSHVARKATAVCIPMCVYIYVYIKSPNLGQHVTHR